MLFFISTAASIAQNWKSDYDFVTFKPKEGIYLARKAADWFYVKESGKKLVATGFTTASEFQEAVAIAKNDKQFVMVTLKGEIIELQKEFTMVKDFKNGYAEAWQGSTVGVINKLGKLISSSKYHTFYVPADGLSVVANGIAEKVKYGYVNLKGEEIVAPKFVLATAFKNGRAFVQEEFGSNVYVINSKGEKILTAMPDNIFNEYIGNREFVNGVALFKNAKGYGAIDSLGKIITHGEYDKIVAINNEIFRVNKNNKYGCINNKGLLIVPLEYDYISGLGKNLLLVEKEKKHGIINHQNKIIIQLEYESVSGLFNDGVLHMKKNGKYGSIDATGKIIIPFEYESIGYFNNGIASVKQNGLYGAIDKKNKVVIPFEYQNMYGFESGYSYVQKNGKYGIIDMKNNVVVPFQYKYIDSKFILGTAIVFDGMKYGLIDFKNNVLLENKYSNLSFSSSYGFVNAFIDNWENGKRRKIDLSSLWKK